MTLSTLEMSPLARSGFHSVPRLDVLDQVAELFHLHGRTSYEGRRKEPVTALERHTAALERQLCRRLDLAGRAFVLEHQIVGGILLMPRIGVLRRSVDADADQLLVRRWSPDVLPDQDPLGRRHEPDCSGSGEHLGPQAEPQRRGQLHIRKQHAA